MKVGGFRPTVGGLHMSKTAVPAGVPMPEELVQQLEEYRQWALNNERDANRDTTAFWFLKIPAILFSASSSALAYFNAKGIAIVAGSVSAICVLVDGLNPRGELRNVHWKAFNEISKLVADMDQDWRIASLNGTIKTPEEARVKAARMIADVRPEVDRINQYIIEAEGWSSGKKTK